MDATTRWETEAIRSSTRKRSNPPRPTSKRSDSSRSKGTWMTLKEAEAATGIPSNTLRKWVRKEAVDSYLESDGELALRMINLASITARAEALGRTIAPVADASGEPEIDRSHAAPDTRAVVVPAPSEDKSAGDDASSTATVGTASSDPDIPRTDDGMMIVPIDAWNKMLNQLGNLHEAGQQLADARERAAKAETEAIFLRERLAEIRTASSPVAAQAAPVGQPVDPQPVDPQPPESQPADTPPDRAEPEPAPARATQQQTTTYWKYLTTGWRDRKRRFR